MSIYQLLAIVIGCLILLLAVKGINERFSVFITIAIGIVLLTFVCLKLSNVISFIRHLSDSAGVKNKYYETVLKGLGICYLGEFTVSACKDCGQNGWGDKVELACRCTLLVLAIPLFEEFLDVLVMLLG